jgi:hypothetical protein
MGLFLLILQNKGMTIMQQDSQYFIECLRQDLEHKVGRTMKTPSDFNVLILEIQKVMKESPSISTLKRLWQYVPVASSRSMTTLNTLSRFLGYRDWPDYIENLMRSNRIESSFLSSNTLLASKLEPGDVVDCEWNPGRHVSMQYLGDNRFKVLTAEMSKLKEGFTLTAMIFSKGNPLFATEVMDGDTNLGNYIAGKESGLTTLRYIPAKN